MSDQPSRVTLWKTTRKAAATSEQHMHDLSQHQLPSAKTSILGDKYECYFDIIQTETLDSLVPSAFIALPFAAL